MQTICMFFPAKLIFSSIKDYSSLHNISREKKEKKYLELFQFFSRREEEVHCRGKREEKKKKREEGKIKILDL